VRIAGRAHQGGPDLYDINKIGDHPPNYNRILLSPCWPVSRRWMRSSLNPWDWYPDNHITLHAGKSHQVDRVKRIVYADDGTEEEYDRLLMCTGSVRSSCRRRART
jgi:nitrite reductase (NADH) large subunit